MMTTPLIEKVRAYASNILQNELKESLKYHNYDHTVWVVEATWEIAKHLQLSTDEIELLLVAAWFHDTGHRLQALNHEDEIQVIAQNFLEKIALDPHKIHLINGCIRATKMPQNPQNLYEQIICDADLSHLGRADFAEKSELLRQEWQVQFQKEIPQLDFCFQNIQFLKNHTFFTEYGKNVFGKVEQENILKEQKTYELLRKINAT